MGIPLPVAVWPPEATLRVSFMESCTIIRRNTSQITLVITLQIICPFSGSFSYTRSMLPWSEEIARYLFLWLTWVGASYATKERKHVSIDLVYEKLPVGIDA